MSRYPVEKLLHTRHYVTPTVFFNPSEYASITRRAEVIGLHIAVSRPLPGDAEPNRWRLIVETTMSSSAIIDLRQIDPQGHTIVICQQRQQLSKRYDIDEFFRTWQVRVRGEATVSDWLDVLTNSGATRYQLVDGRGNTTMLSRCALLKANR